MKLSAPFIPKGPPRLPAEDYSQEVPDDSIPMVFCKDCGFGPDRCECPKVSKSQNETRNEEPDPWADAPVRFNEHITGSLPADTAPNGNPVVPMPEEPCPERAAIDSEPISSEPLSEGELSLKTGEGKRIDFAAVAERQRKRRQMMDELWKQKFEKFSLEAESVEPELSEEQMGVVRVIETGANVMITGPGGSGKSTILKYLKRKGNIAITASTGIAAVNIGGVTIHSWAGLGLGEGTPEEIAGQILEYAGKVMKRIKAATRLAIDEISMISAQLFWKLDQVLRIVREDSRPFGGIQLVLFGDFLQLPPVMRDQGPTDRVFAFQSSSWRGAGIKTILLTKIYRQSDQEMIDALSDIREGRVTERARVMLAKRYRQPDPDPENPPIIVHTTNANVDAENTARLEAINAPESIYEGRDEGEPGPLAILEKHCLAPKRLVLKPGARVMLLTNIKVEDGLSNGTLGTVVACEDGEMPIVHFQSAGLTIPVAPHSFDLRVGGVEVACRFQFPLRLAYAITTHKSQGMTLSKIRVYLSKCFEDGQAYVALSRARTMDGLFIESSAAGCIRANHLALDFYGVTL